MARPASSVHNRDMDGVIYASVRTNATIRHNLRGKAKTVIVAWERRVLCASVGSWRGFLLKGAKIRRLRSAIPTCSPPPKGLPQRRVVVFFCPGFSGATRAVCRYRGVVRGNLCSSITDFDRAAVPSDEGISWRDGKQGTGLPTANCVWFGAVGIFRGQRFRARS